MGLEHRIAVEGQEVDALKQILSNAPHFASYDQQYAVFFYRANITADPKIMPDAMASVQEHGFYFCDNCGLQSITNDVLDYLRAAIEATGQVFVIEDLE